MLKNKKIDLFFSYKYYIIKLYIKVFKTKCLVD